MATTYEIKPAFWLVKDEASVKFHVASDDYFGSLATVIELIKQELAKDSPDYNKIKASFARLKDDLLLLQERYKIETKE